MNAAACVLVVTAFATAPALAWSPYNAQNALHQQIQPDSAERIDHLFPGDEPVPQIEHDKCRLTFRVEPSFSKSGRWCLELSGGSYVLRSWISRVAEAHGVDEIAADEVAVAIPDEIAEALEGIWTNALLESRYGRYLYGGADGEMYYFGAAPQYSGLYLQAKTWSPRGDTPPVWLVHLGTEVLAYVRETRRDTQHLQRRVLAIRDRLYSYYGKLAKH